MDGHAGPAPTFDDWAPRCPVHGPMKPRQEDAGNGYAASRWVCPGWDVEGCDQPRPAPRTWDVGLEYREADALAGLARLGGQDIRVVLW